MARSLVRIVLLTGVVACGTEPAGPPAALEDLSGASLTGIVGQELADPLVIRVTDAEGRPVPGVVVDFTVTAGNGQVTEVPTTQTTSSATQFSVAAGAAVADSTDGNGEVRARWTLGTSAGEQRVSVTVPSLAALTITAEAAPGAPAELTFAEASAFVGIAGQQADGPIVAVAVDEFDNPVPDVTVSWAAVSGGGSVGTASTVTDAQGRTQTTVTLGPGHGLHLFTVVSGTLGPDTIGVIAVVGASDPDGDAFSTGDPSFPSLDVTFFGAAVVDATIIFYTRFTSPVAALSVSGTDPSNALLAFLEFDTDRDSTNGFWPIRRCAAIDSLGFGVDLFIDIDQTSTLLQQLQNPPPGAIPVTRVDSLTSADRCDFSQTFFGGLVATVPVYRASTVSFSAPLSFFQNGGEFDFTSLFLNGAVPALTDIVPDLLPLPFDLTPGAMPVRGRSDGQLSRHVPAPYRIGEVRTGAFQRPDPVRR